MSIYTNDNVNDSFREEPDAGKPHVRNSVRGVPTRLVKDPVKCPQPVDLFQSHLTEFVWSIRPVEGTTVELLHQDTESVSVLLEDLMAARPKFCFFYLFQCLEKIRQSMFQILFLHLWILQKLFAAIKPGITGIFCSCFSMLFINSASK